MRGLGTRRLVHPVGATVALFIGVLGSVVLPGTAYADGAPLAQLTAAVNSPQQANGLLNLCVTSRSLDPSGTCINIPPSGNAPASPFQSYGTAWAYTGLGRVLFYFQGQITIAGRTFMGEASGSASAPGVSGVEGSGGGQVSSFMLSGTSPTGSLTAACTGEFAYAVGDITGAKGGAVSRLDCDGSANGGPVGHVTLISAYSATGGMNIHGGFGYEGPFVGY